MGRYFVWALLVMLAACSSGGSSVTNSGNNPSGGNPDTPTGNVTATVSIVNYTFSPSSVSIKVGSSVMWTNNDPVAHTSTSDGGTWNSGQLSSATGGGAYGGTSPGGSYTFTFTSTGTFPYHCTNHPPSSYPGFTGTITVTP